MPQVTIDGQVIDVAPGTNVIEAARKKGIAIPYYCYHPALTVVASCRMCQVEILEDGKPPRVVAACRTEATPGLKVSTTGDECKKARAANLEFLLANHPLDCPICDKAGECDLQDFSYFHGFGQGRFVEKKRELQKRELIGNHILLDQERCILCTRCVRFMGEYAKAPSLVVAGRADRNVIATFPGQKIESNYEGNLADICPVGALTLKEFRFKSRVWDLQSFESVCTLCDRNCSVKLDVKRGRLLRVRPRENPDVNGYFMCDKGRFGLLKTCNPENPDARATASLHGTPAATSAAVAATATALSERAGAVVIVLSARLTNEEIFLAERAFRSVARADGFLFVPTPERGGDGILYTGREAANEGGLRRFSVLATSRDELSRLLADSGTKAALFFDAALAVELAPPTAVFTAAMDVTTPDSTKGRAPDIFVPGLLFSEKDGTMINFAGVLQRLRRAQAPPIGAMAERDFLERMTKTLAPEAPVLTGTDLTYDTLHALGQEPRSLQRIPRLGFKLRDRAEVPAS